ncbi:MAG: hemolysin III family protein [Aquabacterium sp.]|nr:hemolysin III family protein [Aquabacterium sp.]
MQDEPSFSQTGQEERANAASHALGCLLALLAMPALAQQADAARHPMHQLGVLVFITSMVLMYGVSALYHAAPVGAAKRWLRQCDHAVIFLFIAGSYTPFALAALQRGEGAGTLAAVWGVALVGTVLKLANRLRHQLASTLLYLAFGWLVAAMALPMLAALPQAGLHLLVAGGLAYSLGCVFFLLDRRMPYSHLVWHLFVITGSTCHFLAVQALV